MIRDRLQVLLATGALAIGFTSAARAHVLPRYQIEADAPAAAEESTEVGPKIEKHIIVETSEADSDAAAAKQERRVIVRTQVAGDAEDNDGDEPGTKQKKIIIRTMDGDAHAENSAGREVAWLGLSAEEASEALAAQLGLQVGE